MLTPQEKAERDPAAIQREILSLVDEIDGLDLDTKAAALSMAKMEFEVAKVRAKLLKDKISGLQSVLKSVGTF